MYYTKTMQKGDAIQYLQKNLSCKFVSSRRSSRMKVWVKNLVSQASVTPVKRQSQFRRKFLRETY